MYSQLEIRSAVPSVAETYYITLASNFFVFSLFLLLWAGNVEKSENVYSFLLITFK